MDALKLQSALPGIGVRATHAAPVVIATDGRMQSDSALVVGRMLAGQADALRVVTVLKTMPVMPEGQLAVTADLDAARRAAVKRDVVTQMNRTWDDESDLELREGDAATIVGRLAHQIGATMIVAGLGRHRVADRVFGDETALRLIRMADVPVLAVANGLDHAPRRIVVAIDFSETALRAARMAIEVASSHATVYLAHVAPRDAALYAWKGWGTAYGENAGDALHKTREQLRVSDDMVVQTVVLQGDPATELLAFASSVNADLIATGSHGHGFVARMLIGSVTTRIVRCSTCSVLTVPHRAVMTRQRTVVEPATITAPQSLAWRRELDDFSKRNFGRRGVLEVDDPEIGAQAQEFDYPLLGAVFDPHDRRVELMFGDAAPSGRHLTRGIGGVTQVEMMRNEAGTDIALRIGHGDGQTLLTFAP